MAAQGFNAWSSLNGPIWNFGLPKSLIAPTFPAPKIVLPTLTSGFNFQTIGQNLARYAAPSFAGISIPGIGSSLLDAVRASLPSWEDMARGVFPNNIVDAEADIKLSEMKAWMLSEGLPIAWVPRASTIDALHRAETPAARRAALGKRWRSVLTDCEELLACVRTTEVTPFAAFAQKAIDGVRAGHHELAQAFTANTLDTTVLRWMPQGLRQKVTMIKTRQDPDTFSSRQFFAFAQLQGIYTSFYPDKGDPIPATFNRHGAAHGVSRRQYSRINSVIGVAHLTSWLWFVDTSFARA